MAFKAFEQQARVIRVMPDNSILLVWEPGVGKTFPVLISSMFVGGPTLAIVPAHLRQQWLENAKEHIPFQRSIVLDEPSKKIPDGLLDNYDFVICSYEYVSTLKRWKQLRVRKWGAIAIDECHYLVNEEANRVRAILGASADHEHGLVFAAPVTWLLSGTPFTYPHEIYPILSRVFPRATRRDPADASQGYMSAAEWRNAFCVVEDTGFGEKVVDTKNVKELRQRIKPFLDKCKLTDAVDMPPLRVDTIHIKSNLPKMLKGLDPEVLAQYQTMMQILQDEETDDEDKLDALNNSELLPAQIRHHIAVAKIEPTAEIIRDTLKSGIDKLLVFGWHRAPLKALADKFKGSSLIYGGMLDPAKAREKDRFIDGDARVLFGQITAMGTGTDGLQHVCHRGLFFEYASMPRPNKQCIHRLFRTGQTNPVHFSFVSLKNSVDEHAARVLKKRTEIVSRALD